MNKGDLKRFSHDHFSNEESCIHLKREMGRKNKRLVSWLRA